MTAYDLEGNDVTGQAQHYAGGVSNLFYSPLDLSVPSKLDANDLGGEGPRVVRFLDTTTTRTGGSVALEIHNSTEYRPANRNLNGFHSNMFQLNLAPIFSRGATSETPPFVQLAQQAGLTLDSTHTNMVALWCRFIDPNTGADVELDEFSISVFDFDQDFADGSKAYIRESLLVADWTTAFVSNTTQVETTFAEVPVHTVTSLDPSSREPNGWGIDMKRGVTIRSTEQGTGPAFATKFEWASCQGACLQTPVCNVSQLQSAHSPMSPVYWSGCGFSDDGFGTPDSGPDASYLDSTGSPGARQ